MQWSENKFVDWMQKVQEEVKAALTKVKDNMAQYYDDRPQPPHTSLVTKSI